MIIIPRRKWHYPLADERFYQKELTSLVNQMHSAVISNKDRINSYIKTYRLDDDESIVQLELIFDSIDREYRQRIAQEFIESKVKQMFDGVNRFNEQEFRATMKNGLKLDVFQSEPWLNQMSELWNKDNVTLIKSVEAKYFENIESIVSNAVRDGTLLTDVTEDIQQATGVSQRRAQLIARDQVGKLNGQLTRQRQTGVGIDEYVWSTSKDDSVRKAHQAREGEKFSWNNPPSDGHPGMPISCRCVALPVIDTDKIKIIGVRR